MRFQRWLSVMLLALMLIACGGKSNNSGSPSLPANTIQLTMLYGSEKQAWVDDVVKDFNASGVKSQDGNTIQVIAKPMGSVESIQAIIDGTEQAEIWSPASGLYLPLAADQWQKAKGGTPLFDQNDSENLVLSPVVIAMWKPMAKALGWPDKDIGWSDLADITTSGKSWADFGHPEWGAFQFGHTHPEYSNSGLATIIAMSYAGANKTSQLTLSDVQDPKVAELINKVEQSVIHYGSSTGFFAKTMFEHGPTYLSAAIMYENLVIESYDQGLQPNIEMPVVAIYPREGSFWSDHPFVTLNTPSMTPEKRQAAKLFRDFLLAKPQQEKALKYGFRPANIDVPVGAPLDSAHGVDVTQLHVALPVPSVEVIKAIQNVWQINKKQVDVALVIDTSGSMRQENRLREAKNALNDFLGIFADNDQVQVTVFSTNSTLLSPLTAIGPKRNDLRNSVSGLVANGDTRLYSTISEVYADLNKTHDERIRALVVLTDGEDTASTMNVDDLISQIKVDESGNSIKIFTIAYGDSANFDILKKISESTGAKSYRGDPATIKHVYDDIATFF